MNNREKVIKGLKHCGFGDPGPCYENDCPYYQSLDCTDELKKDILDLLKEQEVKEQCLKTKCVICPHCANCDVDENGLLKEQKPIPCGEKIKAGDIMLDFYECGYCNNAIRKPWRYCPFCGKEVKWE